MKFRRFEGFQKSTSQVPWFINQCKRWRRWTWEASPKTCLKTPFTAAYAFNISNDFYVIDSSMFSFESSFSCFSLYTFFTSTQIQISSVSLKHLLNVLVLFKRRNNQASVSVVFSENGRVLYQFFMLIFEHRWVNPGYNIKGWLF